jgi:ADP-heptose:LPS heptosyltransferase
MALVDHNITDRGLVADVERIAVLRANALGDLVFALPAFEALRAAYPTAEIVLLARDWHRGLLDGRPGPIDRVVAIPDGVLGDETEAARGVTPLWSLRGERFDIGVQLHGGGRHSNPFVARLDARVTAGARADDAAPLDRTIPYRVYQSEVFRALEIVRLVGAEPVTIEPRLAVVAADLDAADAVLPDDLRPLAVLHPGASDPRRRWPAERFAEVADALAADGCRVVVTGTAEELPITRALLAAARAPVVDLAGRLDLSALVGLLARAAVVVSNDTGPLHLAAAVGASTVGLFWYGNLVNAGPPFRARHRPLLAWQPTCPRCGA